MGAYRYKERDCAYGATMLTLRTTIGLTQDGLANHLGVSRRAVGEWEGGSSYPKVDHLKEVIALAVKQQAWPSGHEAEEIRALWKAARQKVPLSESWLASLLEHTPGPHLQIGPKTVEEASIGQKPLLVPMPTPPAPGPRVDWGDALAISHFYGREEELALLTKWIIQERCRVVSLLGIGGIGKSALSVSLMYTLSEHFEVVIFRSLRDAPALEVLLDSCLQVLSPEALYTVPAGSAQGTIRTEQRLDLLLECLRQTRTLLVLDNLECLLSAGDPRGQFLPGFLGYGQLLHRMANSGHQSCLLFTSREKPADLRLLSSKYPLVRSLRLTGLSVVACKQFLAEKDVTGTEIEQERLIEAYSGNPLALMIVAETIVDLFGGNIGPFLAENTAVFGSITTLLDEQFARLSVLEQSVLCWLSLVREPVTLDELQTLLNTPRPLLEAVDSLRRRSLIECGKRVGSFTLQSVVIEYVTGVLVASGRSEIQRGRLDWLIEYGLSLSSAKEYVRQTQERLLLSPLLADLQSVYWGQANGGITSVERQLLSLLDQLRKETDAAQGYGPANLIALLRLQRGHLKGLDLSQLSIRGAYLQGSEMQDTNLAGALIRDIALTEALDAIWGVAISRKGTWWAAGSRRGEVRVWDGESQTLHLVWRAHTDIVSTLALSPDERTLATGSWDGTIKLWNLDSGALLWMGGHANTASVAFSPDGRMLASSGRDTTVKLWDTQRGKNLQILQHPGYVYAVAWSPDGHLLATGAFDGCIRLWQIEMSTPAACVQTFSEHTNWVMGLAFAPDGRTLASGSWDHTVKLWDVASGRMRETLSGHTDKVHCVAWSPDGRILASCSVDKTIRLWDIDQHPWGSAPGGYRAVLREHTSAVYDLCFTPDSSHLLTGSDDGTLRVWEVESRRCMRVIQGYAVSFYDIDWSPDSTQLVSGGTDALVTIWDTIGDTPPRALHGHSWMVEGVGWSPDGRYLASCGWDTVVRLWDPTTGTCIHQLQDPATFPTGIAWSPDGQLLAYGTLMHGVQIWDVTTGNRYWSPRMHSAVIRRVAWSPDGTRLAAGGDEGSVYLWDATDGGLHRQLRGHHGIVARVVWSPDGRFLASCGGSSGNGELFVWNMQTCRVCRDGAFSHPLQTFDGHPGVVYALVWSPNGDRLVTGGSDGMLRWWDVQSRECVSRQEAHQGIIHSLRMSPDGKRLASCGNDGAIRIWDLLSATHVRTLRRDRPYERLNITGIRGLTEAEIASLQALGAIDEATGSL